MALPSAQLVTPAGFIKQLDASLGSGAGLGVNQYGQELSNSEGRKPTYSACINAYNAYATPQDMIVLTGNASVVARLLAVEVYLAATAAAAYELGLYLNSAPDTSGTSSALTAVPHDLSDPAAVCSVLSYSASPTTGTRVGLIRAGRVVGGTVTGGGSGILPLLWSWTANNDKAPILRNANQQIALNGFGAALPSGSVFEIRFSWSEEGLIGN